MNKFLFAIGWRTFNGRWIRHEIVFDLGIIGIILIIVLAAYLF